MYSMHSMYGMNECIVCTMNEGMYVYSLDAYMYVHVCVCVDMNHV